MARKTQVLRTLLEAREAAAACHRQPVPTSVAVCLAQIRDYAHKMRPPKARHQIAVQVEEPSETPRVIKIIHIDSI
jgi:hypothetical protein